jgi:hypothetical protein
MLQRSSPDAAGKEDVRCRFYRLFTHCRDYGFRDQEQVYQCRRILLKRTREIHPGNFSISEYQQRLFTWQKNLPENYALRSHQIKPLQGGLMLASSLLLLLASRRRRVDELLSSSTCAACCLLLAA